MVVTIIVLLILAGVAISLTIGNNGIFTRAQDATVRHENASVYEQLQFVVADYQMNAIENNKEEEILAKLKGEGYVNEDNTLNIETLMGRKLNTGNGTLGEGDVYVLELKAETTSAQVSGSNGSLKYYLIYYDEENTAVNLGVAFEENEGENYEPTDPSLFEVSEAGEISLKDGDSYYYNNKEWTIENIVIPSEIDGKKVTAIAPRMFNAFLNTSMSETIKSIVIPNGVITIGYEAFACCEGLTSIKIPDSVTTIGDGAFAECIRLTNIKIPDGVKAIGRSLFSRCRGLTDITIPDGVTTIGDSAFFICNSLTSMTIPDSVTTIGAFAFNMCDNLKTVYYKGTQEQLEQISIEDYNEELINAEIVYNQ